MADRLLRPKLAAPMDAAEEGVPACMNVPPAHRAKRHASNPLQRRNGGIERGAGIVGIFPNEAAIARRAGALPPQRNAARAAQRSRYTILESMASRRDDHPVGPSNMAG